MKPWRIAIAVAALLAATARAETLRIASSAWPPGYGAPYASIAQSASHTRTQIMDALTRIDGAGNLVPGLALAWEPLGGRGWRFRLRPNVSFSNGEPFNAATVKFVVEWLKSDAAKAQLMATEVRTVAEARIVDDLTVDLLTAQPDAVLPRRLALILMVAPRAWSALGPDRYAMTPVGTGSYVLKDWGTGSGRTVIEANPASWRAPKQFTRVELYPLKEPVSRMQALTSGQVDLTQGLGPDDVAALREQGYIIHTEQLPQIMALMLRNVGNENAPLHDVRVRQAMNYAVDKQAIAEVILRGTAQAVGQGAIPGVTGYNPDLKPYPHDVAKAKALLAAAGYGGGLKLVARIQTAGPTEAASIYQKVAADLAEVGVQVELRPVLGSDWVRMYTTGDWGGADVISATWNAAAYYDTIRAIETFSCRKPGAFFCLPEIEPMIDASNAALDSAARERILQDIMARLHDAAPSLFLVNMTSVYAHTSRLKGIVLGSSGLWIEDMSLAR